jgi:hypothetical protein
MVWYADETYCEDCVKLKIQEDIDDLVEGGFIAKTMDGKYELTDKGRAWPEGSELFAESTDANQTNAGRCTTRRDIE